jgi:Single-strand binding protein family
VATFGLAVTARVKDGDISFFRINAWRQLAEHVAESLSKGDRAVVSAAAMWDCAQVALPAALAAGAVGLAFPGDRTAQAVGIAAGLAAKALLNKAVQYAATALLGRSPLWEGPATAAERFQAAKMRADTALSDCVARLSQPCRTGCRNGKATKPTSGVGTGPPEDWQPDRLGSTDLAVEMSWPGDSDVGA